MNIESFRDFCLAKPAVTECFPFDETTLVFKVAGKMFALTDTEDAFSINIKCAPEKAIQLREEFTDVTPGYHMNKQLWNTVLITGSIPDILLEEWINDSYNLIVAKLTKKERQLHNL
ncbi:MAG TPA: MmcQ-like protein [Bacteroidales bacterium]|nr:MmcQ-like protein [Bacteroidales bacterium]